MGEEKNVQVEKKAVSKTNTWLQVREKEDKLKKIDEEIENAKKLKKEIKREISQGKIRVVREEERRLDAVVGVAIRWASYADTKLQKRLMEVLDEFYFDDRNRSFLGFDLLPTEKKNECEKTREAERKRRKESTGKDTYSVRVTREPQSTDPIIETTPPPVEPQKKTLPAKEKKGKVELIPSTEKSVGKNSGNDETAGRDTSTLDDLNDIDGEQSENPKPSDLLPDFAKGAKKWNGTIYKNKIYITLDNNATFLTPEQIEELTPFATEIRDRNK